MIDLHLYRENHESARIRGAIIFLPGRTNYAYSMVRKYTKTLDLSGVGLFGATPPISQGWYPPPSGPDNQENAVGGLRRSADAIDEIIDKVCREYDLARDKIILSGFSMGGVAGVHWATLTKDPVAAMICHSGAILEPWKVPRAKHGMPIVINHGEDDDCFDWHERYVPMRSALIKKGYKVQRAERDSGGHYVHPDDISACLGIFEKTFGAGLEWRPRWVA